MKLLLAIALLLSLTMNGILVNVSAQNQLGCTFSTCKITVNRTLLTNDWGTTVMNDTVSLNATTPVAYLDLGVPSSLGANLGFWKAVDSKGTAVRVTKLSLDPTGSFVPLRVEMPGKNGSYSFTLETVFSKLLAFNNTSKGYTLTYSPFPVVDNSTKITTARLTVETGDWASVTPSGILGTVTTGKFQTQTGQLEPLNTTLGKLSFTSSTQNQFEVVASRLMTISQSGKIQVADSYNITNRGRDVPNVVFLLPKGTASLTVSDIIGPLEEAKVNTSLLPNGTSVAVSPRFGTVVNGGGLGLKLGYDLSSDGYVTSSSLGLYSLKFQMFNNVKFVGASLQTKVLVPTGFRLDSVTGQTVLTSAGQVLLVASRVGPLTDLSFSISYRLDPFWASLSPLGLVGMAELALAAGVLVFAAGSAGVAVKGLAPAGLIGRFVELLDEKASLRLEAEKLEEDMSRGAVNRQDFRRRRRVIDLRVSEIERQLGPVKQDLGASQARYADLVRRIDRAEAELQGVRSSMADLRNQYRGGRMARELYESLMSDLVRRKERGQQTVDNIVIGLREEAR